MHTLRLLSLTRLLLLALVGAALSSCSFAPRYQQARASGSLAPRPGQALVIVYWDSSFLTSNAGNYNVYASVAEGAPERRIAKGLTKGKFCTIDSAPGSVNLSVRHAIGPGAIVDGVFGLVGYSMLSPNPRPSVLTLWKKGQLSLVTEPGRTYFVNTHWKRLGEYAELREVTEAQALPELSRCRWLNPSAVMGSSSFGL
jgi:hypothetical protein